MFCTHCGGSFPDGAAFCPTCGGNVAPVPAATGATATSAAYSGFWRRFAAYLADSFILSVPFFFLFLTLSIGAHVAGRRWHQPGVMTPHSILLPLAFLGIALLSATASWLYEAIFLSSSRQATPGKMAVGIVVTDLAGNRISFSCASGRFFAKILSSMTLNIGYIMAAFTERKQALHDMLAGTLVMKK